MPNDICRFNCYPGEGLGEQAGAGISRGERHLWAACASASHPINNTATRDEWKGQHTSERAHKRKTFPNGLLSTTTS